MEKKPSQFWIEYKFDFFDKRQPMAFTVLMDKKTLNAISPEGSSEEPWTKLDFCKCSVCPLDSEKVRNCPIAYNISGLAKKFSDIFSVEEADITVRVEDRSYYKKDTVQQGLRSVLGIYLAASGCPHMEILKPMARFHLPFASMEETIYRHASNYLLGEYFEYLESGKMDFKFENIITKYRNIDKVNHGICNRIEFATDKDASKNALVILNVIGVIMHLELEANLNSLKYIFKSESSFKV
jgi:hypothetical protein